jgi:molybdopterin-biosynthesis enzyme MoeA-like protein
MTALVALINMSITPASVAPRFGLIIIGDEILSGKRADKHLPKVIELLKARGLQLDYAEYVGDAPQRITATLKRAFASGDVVFSTGGIGATPDDHTRQCAAQALGVELALQPQAAALITQRMQEIAQQQGTVYVPDDPNNMHRLNMGVFPVGAQIIPNPYNKIPGFFCMGEPGTSAKRGTQGGIFFLPGFPVMAWPMIEWVLDTHYRYLFQSAPWIEQSVIVYGAMEATLTPLMQEIERDYAGIKVFSLPSVDHPQYGRHIELGVKGEPNRVAPAYAALLAGLHSFEAKLGPELVQK